MHATVLNHSPRRHHAAARSSGASRVERRLPGALESSVRPSQAWVSASSSAGPGVRRGRQRRLRPEGGRLGQRAQRAGVSGRPAASAGRRGRRGPARCRWLATSAAHAAAVGCRGGLDGQRHREMGALRVAQVGAGGLGEQRMAVAPGRRCTRPDRARCRAPPARHRPCAGRARDLGRGQRPARRRDRLGELAGAPGSPPSAARTSARRLGAGRRASAVRGHRAGALDREQRVAVGDGPTRRAPRPGAPRHCAPISATSRGCSGPSSTSVTSRPRPARSASSASASARAGRSRRVRTNSTGSPASRAADVGAERQARPVGPVDVLGDEQHRPARRRPLDEPEHGVEDPQPFQLRRGDAGGGGLRRPSATPGPARACPARRASRAARGGGGTTATSARASSCHTAAGPRHRRRRLRRPRPARRRRRRPPGQLADQPRLADARLTGDARTTRPRPSRAAAHAALSVASSRGRARTSARARPGGSGVARARAAQARRAAPGWRARARRPARRAAARRARGPTTSAPARSPAAARCSISTRWAGSSSGVSAQRRAASAAASAGSRRGGHERVEPGDAAPPVLGARGGGPVVVEPGTRLAVPRPGSSRSRRAVAQRDRRRACVITASGPSARRSAHTAVRRFARASGRRARTGRPARRARAGPGCSARNAESRRCGAESGTGSPSRATAISPRSRTHSTGRP